MFLNVFVNIYIFRRQPKSLVKPVDSNKPELQDKYEKKIENQKSSATRHIFLIRHGQYNVSGETDREKKLTELGMYLISMNNNKCLCPKKIFKCE
jgi:hypothetical protein